MPRAGWVKPVSDRPLSDLMSVGVLTRVFPPGLVDEVIADCGVRAQLRFLDGLRRLSAAGGQGVARRRHRLFGSDAVESVAKRVGRQTVNVHGISYRMRDVQENLVREFRRSKAESLNLGLLHANVGGNELAREDGLRAPWLV